ncbi:MAG: hypothetical protein BRC29_00320 [Nanohaloarchaea archaeon SW_7_43_1]|nr:MAG: hypothetical protein BRC29_00320 [Nanohaloarchaea archaeon SW_7_43_1]
MLSEHLISGSNQADDFAIPIEEVPSDLMEDIARRRNLKSEYLPEGTDVRYWEIENSLEKSDDRRDHGRVLDAAIQEAIELYDDRSWDIVLSNVDYDIRDISEKSDFENRSNKWYYGEIDLMLVDLDEQWVRAYEAKPHRGRPQDHNGRLVYEAPTHEEKAEEQFRRQSFAFDLLNEELEDFEMHYVPEDDIYETELDPRMEIPDRWEGSYYWTDEAKDKTLESEAALSFISEFVLPENPMIFAPENEFERKEIDDGEFIAEFLDS